MKIKGKKIEGPNVEVIVIPRGVGPDIVFMAQAILDMEPFEKMCPTPVAPMKMVPGGAQIPNLQDVNFLKALEEHSIKRLSWMVLISLQATEGLEWDNVDISDHTTWNLFREEMKESGFSDIEINRIVGCCVSVNALSDAKIDAAREHFLLTAQGE